MATPVEKKFNKAVWLIRNGPPNPNPNTARKLEFYSLFKQATLGDVEGSQPWAVQLEARAKWDAWAKLKGMSKEEAMQKYIDLLATGKLPNFFYYFFSRHHPFTEIC
jgi:diazepam-binding inhibitor (GABA receptor modulating acyl-CoA-binding protein)